MRRSKDELDPTDRALIACLQRNARIPCSILAAKAGLSQAECVRRVRGLEDSGVIRRYVTLLDPRALGLTVRGLLRVKLDRHTTDRMQAFEAAIRDRAEVLECWQTAGSWDFEMFVVVKDLEAYEAFQRECLSAALGVVAVSSSVAVRQVKYRTDLPVSTEDSSAPTVADSQVTEYGSDVLFVRDDASPRALGRARRTTRSGSVNAASHDLARAAS